MNSWLQLFIDGRVFLLPVPNMKLIQVRTGSAFNGNTLCIVRKGLNSVFIIENQVFPFFIFLYQIHKHLPLLTVQIIYCKLNWFFGERFHNLTFSASIRNLVYKYDSTEIAR
jgi:hypothetical protein